MPWKTILTIATFAGLMQALPMLRNLKIFDPKTIALVWEMPVPKPPEAELAAARAVIPPLHHNLEQQAEEPAATRLLDPTHQMDHFYASLAASANQGGVTRV